MSTSVVGRMMRPAMTLPSDDGVRERQPHDLADDGAELAQQGAAVVGDAVALADVAYFGRDLGVAPRRHVREQVVLDRCSGPHRARR